MAICFRYNEQWEKIKDLLPPVLLLYISLLFLFGYIDGFKTRSKDNIFLLSLAQAENYMTQNERRADSGWLLRSLNINNLKYVWFVRYDNGDFRYDCVNYSYDIRPAMWIKIYVYSFFRFDGIFKLN